jgi:Holliday junction resolvase-like predicted endonuclease
MELPHHLRIGQLGEDLAVRYLEKEGFRIVDRNYRRPWGELDIVAEKKGRIYFVEVKSVSREILPDLREKGRDKDNNVPHGTSGGIKRSRPKDEYDPSDNVHPWKRRRLSKIIETYLLDMDPDREEPEWQVDVLCVYISMSLRQARVERIEDIDL